MAEQNNQQTSQKRQIAYKIKVKGVSDGKYVKEGGWQPNYIDLGNGKRISRVNIIATVVQNSEYGGNSNYRGIVLDDGSSRISARSFENPGIFDGVSVSDAVLIVGKPREFGNEKYILAEIVKKVDPVWIKVRNLELGSGLELQAEPKNAGPEEVIECCAQRGESPTEKIFRMVKELDKGNGADVDEVVSAANVDDAERIIVSLLEEGELFEVRAGRLKVLE